MSRDRGIFFTLISTTPLRLLCSVTKVSKRLDLSEAGSALHEASNVKKRWYPFFTPFLASPLGQHLQETLPMKQGDNSHGSTTVPRIIKHASNPGLSHSYQLDLWMYDHFQNQTHQHQRSRSQRSKIHRLELLLGAFDAR